MKTEIKEDFYELIIFLLSIPLILILSPILLIFFGLDLMQDPEDFEEE